MRARLDLPVWETSRTMRVHFVGIGGQSMSGLAMMMREKGHEVTGSDRSDGMNIACLRDAGIGVTIGHDAAQVHADLDAIVVSGPAISEANTELRRGVSLGVPIVERAELLGSVASSHRRVVAVAGTRGKTTTASLCGAILSKAGLDPTVSVGALVENHGNYRVGMSEICVLEACEYHRAFLELSADLAIILNLPMDHTDYFSSQHEFEDAFVEFMLRMRLGGRVVIFEEAYAALADRIPASVTPVVFGFGADSTYRISRAAQSPSGSQQLTLAHKGEELTLDTPLMGEHNVPNVAAAVVVGLELDLAHNAISAAVSEFSGAPRRQEYLGEKRGVRVYDDTASHPVEARAALNAIRGLPRKGRLVAVLCPNSFVRVRDFFDDFVSCFEADDVALVTEVFRGRDLDTFGVGSSDIVAALQGKGVSASLVRCGTHVVPLLERTLVPGDVLLTLGPNHVRAWANEWLAR
ncbi:MAG: UDP-N-acetylmuramate--L-alanine ligase [Nocardioides sp.]